ncbi:GNAT family N-acetyltransferase [Pseudonocardia endophytica]|uniref:ElaA protein n=1 Tax=Pseudonocardia endophytica TaxID=401976 RepID=A0A4R1HT51_PSEEN|nr:GNAT family N-acetyltransferase [Pseudonocardia endophytica]TCK25378.1 ElaA protein [Pseudonocardia endophytica]
MSVDTRTATVRRSWALDLDGSTLYALLRLRVDVFVVEQRAAYPDLDGRDLEERTRHYWLADADGAVLGTLRLLKEPDGGYRIGRVCTRADVRGRGLGAQLMTAAMAEAASKPCVLDAQSRQVGFYERFGFVTAGAEYVDDDGIGHVPMSRTPLR